MEAGQAIPDIDKVTGLEDARENTGKKDKKKKKKKKKHKHGENDMEDEDEDEDEIATKLSSHIHRLRVIKSLEVAWLPPMVFKKDYSIPSTGDEKKDARTRYMV